jgi:hypothetical protein
MDVGVNTLFPRMIFISDKALYARVGADLIVTG